MAIRISIGISLRTVLAALVFAAIGAGGAVGVMLWEPWEDKAMSSPTEEPTPRGARLTGSAAALKAQAWARDNFRRSFCEPEDFDEQTGTWVTVCSFTTSRSRARRSSDQSDAPAECLFRLKVNGSTGMVSIVEKDSSIPPRPVLVCN